MEVFDGKRVADLEREIARLERELREMRLGLRDQFAMAALTGVLTGITHVITPEMQESCAAWVYSMAEAMLQERRRHGVSDF
ncbi:MAG TPA: hypothetical protein PK225_02545 [Azonexus sp.]|nr:hypothetical protein [Azonexus sp.]